MAVDIYIDLNIAEAQAKIAELKGELETLNDLDFGELDLEGFMRGLDDVALKMSEIRLQARGIGTDIRAALRGLDDVSFNVNAPDGGVGSGTGGENGPPGMSWGEFRTKMGDLFGSGETDQQAAFHLLTRGEGPIRDPRTGQFTTREKLARSIFHKTPFGTESLWRTLERDGLIGAEDQRGMLSPLTGAVHGAKTAENELSFMDRLKQRFSTFDHETRDFTGFSESIKRFVPSMRSFYAIVAVLIPLIITFATQALGVATALGAVATAGAAVIGLGLIGHANSMGAAFAQAKYQLYQFKRELFEVFQPTARVFAPISAQFLDRAPQALNRVAHSMQGLAKYSDTIFAAFSGLSDWIAAVLDQMTAWEGVISQLAIRFGAILGQNIIEFFSFLLRQASDNQQTLINLGGALKDILGAIYNVSKAISTLVARLGFLWEGLAALTNLLNNRVVLGLITFLGIAALVIGSLRSLAAWTLIASEELGLLGEASFYEAIAAGIDKIVEPIQALIIELGIAEEEMAGLLAMTGIGLLAVGAGVAATYAVANANPGNPGSGSYDGNYAPRPGQVSVNHNTYNITTYGNMDNASEQRIKSTIADVNRKGTATSTGVSGPAPSTVGETKK